ncbi:MAG TPA: 50S ribosomal protein L11 methyltransferase [Gammaproteobacteria bacterium]|jgi:ribosomal protein L11 methyltransferase|nr:50S ribosomal protein L11 methyltransferase [Gammaproteobacteria bacterium]
MSDAWLTYTCRVRETDVPAVEACLEETGAQAITCCSGADDSLIVETPDASQRLWPVCDVSGLFELDADIVALERCFSARAVVPLQARTTTLHARDWHESWRQQFEPQLFGGRLWVCPTWEAPPPAAKCVIRLDPGMAFGTGHHATTALCLSWLAESTAVAGAKVLDYGCGSGILALAAATLGAAEITAVDIDPAARAVCLDNAALNTSRSILVAAPEAVAGRRYDLIVANILLEPLVELAERFAGLLRVGGSIVLSGVLQEQTDHLLAAYAGAFKMETRRQQGEWALVAGVRERF